MEFLLKFPVTMEAEYRKLIQPTSQRCEISLLLRSDFAALSVHLRNLVDLGCTYEMVPNASRYLRPKLLDIFLQIFDV